MEQRRASAIFLIVLLIFILIALFALVHSINYQNLFSFLLQQK